LGGLPNSIGRIDVDTDEQQQSRQPAAGKMAWAVNS
jgi:hypothetical protein